MNDQQFIRAVKMSAEPHPLREKWWKFCWWIEDNNPFTKYIFVSSSEEYFKLPRRKRTFLWFWYLRAIINVRTTILGKKADREAVDTYLKFRFPIQYIFREKLYYKAVCAYDWLRYKLNPRQKWLTKQIPNEWNDKVALIKDLNFAMVVHFVEGEKCFDSTDYDNSGDGHIKFAKELRECYDYIKNERPKLDKLYWDSFPKDDEFTGDYSVDYADTNRLEKLIDDNDTKWLTWIVTNRGYFWT